MHSCPITYIHFPGRIRAVLSANENAPVDYIQDLLLGAVPRSDFSIVVDWPTQRSIPTISSFLRFFLIPFVFVSSPRGISVEKNSFCV